MSQPPKRPNSQPRPWEQGGDSDAVSFGSWLRRQREMRDIGLREIAEATKISFRYLEALEQDRFEVLPAPVFARGFLREYARCVGIDADDVVNYYLSAQGQDPTPNELPAAAVSALPRKRRDWLYAVTVGAGLLVLLGVVALLATLLERRGAAAVPATSRASSEVSPAPGPPVAATGEAAPPASSIASVQTPTAALPGSPTVVEQPPANRPSPLRLDIEFAANCWVERVIDGGDRLSELRVAGEALTLEANDSILLTLGDARGVRLLLNGRPYPVRPDGNHIVRDLRIDLDDLAPTQ